MYTLFAAAFQLTEVSPKTETIDEVVKLTCHLKLRAVMKMSEVKVLFGIREIEEQEGSNENADLIPPLELIPGFWDGNGNPKNEKTKISFNGLEFLELRLRAFEKIGDKPASKKPFLTFENVRANGFTLTPSYNFEVVLTMALHANDDIMGEHVGRLSDSLSKAGYFTLEEKDLFDMVEDMSEETSD